MICPPGWPPYYKSLWSWVSERVALFIPRVELCHIYCFALSPNMIILKINFDIDRKLPLQADIIIRRIIGALWGAVHSFFWSAATVRPFVPSQKVDLNCLFFKSSSCFPYQITCKKYGKVFSGNNFNMTGENDISLSPRTMPLSELVSSSVIYLF